MLVLLVHQLGQVDLLGGAFVAGLGRLGLGAAGRRLAGRRGRCRFSGAVIELATVGFVPAPMVVFLVRGCCLGHSRRSEPRAPAVRLLGGTFLFLVLTFLILVFTRFPDFRENGQFSRR